MWLRHVLALLVLLIGLPDTTQVEETLTREGSDK